MTFVAVIGYSILGCLSIWGRDIVASDMYLPAMAVVMACVMVPISLAAGKLFASDRKEQGLFACSAAVGNNGVTMGGFVIFLLYGESALGLSIMYSFVFGFLMVFLLFPIARHYASESPANSLGSLMMRSLFDWRSIGLVFTIGGVLLSLSPIQRPAIIERLRVIDIGVYMINAMAYFAIGLRLKIAHAKAAVRLIVGLAGMRFIVSLGVCLCLLWLIDLTPWPLLGLRRDIILVQAFVPMAVTNVAVANMFGLHPGKASAMFVGNTLMYLIVVLPLVIWWLG